MPEREVVAPAGAGAVSPRVVLFDFDGVLICGDSFYLFMRERYRRSWWRGLLALLSTPLLLLQLPAVLAPSADASAGAYRAAGAG